MKYVPHKAIYIWTAATIACMLAIFLFSAQPAEESTEISESMTRAIVETIWNWFTPAGQEVPEHLLGVTEVILRKTAHLFIFFILGLCTANAVKYLTENRRRVFAISILWCSAYGALDELHQYFVPGRACMWQDWLIDTTGAALGITAAVLVAARLSSRLRKSGKSQ